MHLLAQLSTADTLTNQQLEDAITTLAAEIHAAEYRFLTLIAELDRRRGWFVHGVKSCAHWLSWRCGVGLNAARERVRVANALQALPQISEAFRLGTLSYSKVRAISRIAQPENEAWLLNVALTGTASHVERLVRYARKYGEADAIAQANRVHAQRSVSYHWDDDGSLVIKGRLPAEAGALVVRALEAAIDSAGAPPDVTAVTFDPEPLSSRRADALVDLAETFLEAGYREGNAGERYQVQVVVEAEALQRGESAPDAPARIDDGPAIAIETARRITCDASIVALVEAPDGQVLDVGRRTRAIPPAIRRGLKRRDGGCRFPGCDHRRFVDAHHVQHWADGGSTSMNNLVQLCRRCHRLVHKAGFSVARDASRGTFVFRRPDGSVILPSPRAHPAPDGVDDLRRRNRDDGVHVGAHSCRARWGGEVMDYNVALDILGGLGSGAG